MKTPLKNRLFARLDIKGDNACWEWQGWRHPSGYGQIGRGARQEGLVYTHVAAWEIEHAERVPSGMCIRHTCDNPPCCNPKHLVIGTQADNAHDMLSRRRHSFGDAHSSKLSESDVATIRELLFSGATQQSVANQFRVSRSMVGKIARDKVWILSTSDPETREALRQKPMPGDSAECQNGHSYAEVGFYQTADGRRCKACHKERTAKYLANGGRDKKNEQARSARASR